MLDTREYIVTLKDAADLEDFYQDMETPGGLLYIPNRAVEVSNRRPNSRNTHYFLTDKEANMLRNDPRVLEVELNPRDRGVQPGLNDIQTSTAWDKSASDNSNMKNWGLLRCVNGNQIANWGSNGTSSQTASITLTSAGKNVDVVVVDGNGIVWAHPEYTVNSDGTGSSRAIQYNWYQHDPQVKGTPATNYPYTNTSDHATHVCGTIAGNTQGWARSANIYNIYYYAGDDTNDNFPYVIDYVREFHRTKPINPETGRKNPTIVNNSWGMSVFPLEWSYNDITAVTYRGTRYTAGPEVFQGFSGICSATTLISDLNVLENGGNSITTGPNSASVVTMVNPTFSDITSKTVSTQPTLGSNDDGYWQISLPFNISFLGTTYSTVYVGTNMYLTFGSGSTAFSAIDATNPPYPKICLCAKDNSVQRIYYGVEGNSPNRIFTIKIEGTATYLGTLGSPTMILEYTFFEAVPNNIDLVIGINNSKGITATFSTAQLIQWGLIEGQRIPQRVAALDADIEDALAEGIIMVGAAGNGKWKHDVPGGVDWNNTFEMAYRYPGQVYYYMRGTSPTANDNKLNGGDFDINNICVGAVGSTINESKASFSDCGPGVDLYAPGTYIISALPASASSTPDPRNPSYFIGKFSGTSMASPQVCGVLACALETYPNMNQDQAKEYILHYATSDQMFSGTGGPGDVNDLQGSENLYLFYYKERKDSGNVFPKKDYNIRPESGVVYPRTRIKRSY